MSIKIKRIVLRRRAVYRYRNISIHIGNSVPNTRYRTKAVTDQNSLNIDTEHYVQNIKIHYARCYYCFDENYS